jgi:hypothetical protein
LKGQDKMTARPEITEEQIYNLVHAQLNAHQERQTLRTLQARGIMPSICFEFKGFSFSDSYIYHEKNYLGILYFYRVGY